MSATAQHTAEPTPDQKPSRADVLRSIADWMGEHPAASVDSINELYCVDLYHSGPVGVAHYILHDDAEATVALAREIGGTWYQPNGLYVLAQSITPQLEYRLWLSEKLVTTLDSIIRLANEPA